MTSKGKKKAKRKSSYAKPASKAPIEREGARAEKANAGKDEEKAEEKKQWNLIRSGAPELRMFLVLLVFLVVGVLMQYALAADSHVLEYQRETYKKELKRYEKELKAWEQKYESKEARKEHEREKPLKPLEPKKPTLGEFILASGIVFILQGMLLLFLGINIMRRTDLSAPILEEVSSEGADAHAAARKLVGAVPWAIAALVPLLLSVVAVRGFGVKQPEVLKKIPAWKNCLSTAGITIGNHYLVVLVVLSAAVWVFARYKERLKLEPHWAGICATVILAAGYFYLASYQVSGEFLPSLCEALGISLSLAGVCGWLYWKRGLEYSLIAAFVSFGVYPFLATIIAS